MARGAKVPRQGAVHSVAEDEMVMAPKRKPYRASRLESLPAEIRQRVYLFLSIANTGKGWIKCQNWDCTDSSHYKQPLGTGNRGTTHHHGHHQPPFSQIQITQYWFHNYDVFIPMVEGDIAHMDNETYRGYRGLLGTNKFFCADVYTLVYNSIPTKFQFELSSRPIHLNNWQKQHPGTPGRTSDDYYKKYSWEHMKLSPFPFRFMSTIILSHEIGMGYESQMPHRPLVYCKRWGSYLTKQASSIRYIACHCPALRELEILPLVRGIERCKIGVFDVMAFAMQELVFGCPGLKKIALTYSETKKVSLSDYPEIADREQSHQSNFFHDLLFGDDNWFRRLKAQDCLDVRDIPQEMREDAVREWVKGALVKIRKHTLQASDLVPPYKANIFWLHSCSYESYAETFSTLDWSHDFWSPENKMTGPNNPTYYIV
ncbi:hypothetical protein BU16DRAFT_560803 [Lophium mytilinum]|uniref:Uncharacterized protein n=1 Tax=Lophium mytilinum TaxID=390894 RepID=A0A6A6QUV6_9PEZI|nr:hypothetical protein BU16DRAFT_560803 [Lophium mytilinum]